MGLPIHCPDGCERDLPPTLTVQKGKTAFLWFFDSFFPLFLAYGWVGNLFPIVLEGIAAAVVQGG